MANKLIQEKSPYLLQHAHNPVHWYPWGGEAFHKARTEDKPVFLSIGYAACHWCHVMELESFGDPAIAQILNDHFVSIKVDREERPDIDQIYMTVTQRFTGQGGWPMSIFMTPGQEPFAAGTYFPPVSRHGRIGFTELLERIQDLWFNRREDLKREATGLTKKLKSELEEFSTHRSTQDEVDDITTKLSTWSTRATNQLENSFDSQHGGFGSAPKFPSGHTLLFLLREYRESKNLNYLAMAEATLEGMRKGGLWDHVGYGFHRYSTDAHWLVPHFEKMLYDQAMLLLAYTEGYAITGKSLYKDTADHIITYIQREMTHPEGGFYSTEDADSEGEEGKFYTWHRNEILDILGPRNGKEFCTQFGVLPEGNFHHEAGANNSGQNILHGDGQVPDQLRQAMFQARKKRVHPLKDDKILTDWNGLMIAALAYAGQIFQNSQYIHMAEKALDFLMTHLIQPDGTILKRWRQGEAKHAGCLEDYAFVLWGLVELYEARGKGPYLVQAVQVAEKIIRDFEDVDSGGYFTTPIHGEKLILRPKEAYDGALPSGNSVIAACFARLGLLLGRNDLVEKAKNTLLAFKSIIEQQPQGFTFGLHARYWLAPTAQEIVLVGDPGTTEYQEFQEILKKRSPGSVFHCLDTSQQSKELHSLVPALAHMRPPGTARAGVFICSNYVCQAPILDPEVLIETMTRP